MKIKNYKNFKVNESSDRYNNKNADEYYDDEIDNMTLKMKQGYESDSDILFFHDRYDHVVMAYSVHPYTGSFNIKVSDLTPEYEPRIYKHLHTDYVFLHDDDQNGEILISKLQKRFPKLDIDMDALVPADDIGW